MNSVSSNFTVRITIWKMSCTSKRKLDQLGIYLISCYVSPLTACLALQITSMSHFLNWRSTLQTHVVEEIHTKVTFDERPTFR